LRRHGSLRASPRPFELPFEEKVGRCRSPGGIGEHFYYEKNFLVFFLSHYMAFRRGQKSAQKYNFFNS
jgi:hypothetical protein